MTLGFGLFLLAAGLILHFAVTASVSGIDLQVVGTILIFIGILGMVIGAVQYFMNQQNNRRPPGPPPPPPAGPPQY